MAFGTDTPPEVGAKTQFKPGESGNPAGKPKGTKHITTYIQELMEDEKFEARILDPKMGIVDYKGAPIHAVLQVMLVKAVNGDKDFMDMLMKYGWTKKTELDAVVKNVTPIMSLEENDAVLGDDSDQEG